MRERVEERVPTQVILAQIHEEILATTRLPLAIQFLATELKHTGLLASGFARLPHYFTPFQAFVVRQTEEEAQPLQPGDRPVRSSNAKPSTAPKRRRRRGCSSISSRRISRNRLGYDARSGVRGGGPVLRRRLEGVRRPGAPAGRRHRFQRSRLPAFGIVRHRATAAASRSMCRRCRRCSARRRGRSPRRTVAAIRSTCSRRCSASSVIRKCRARTGDDPLTQIQALRQAQGAGDAAQARRGRSARPR